jgi:hypothetical protein
MRSTFAMKSCLLLSAILSFAFAQTYQQFGSLNGEKIQALSNDDTFLYAGTNKGFYMTKTESPNWQKVLAGNCRSIAVGDSLIAVCCDSNIYVSYATGSSLTRLCTIRNQETPQAVAAWGDYVFIGTDKGAYDIETPDTSFDDTLMDSANVHSLFVIDTFFFAGTGDGFYFTTPGDTQWEDLMDDVPISSVNGNDSLVIAAGDSGIWSAVYKNRWWTVDSLDSFPSDSLAKLTTSISTDSVHSFLAIRGRGVYWCGNKATQFYHDNGPSNDTIAAMTICNNQLFLGTTAGAFWSAPLGSLPIRMVAAETQRSFPAEIALSGRRSAIRIILRWPSADRLDVVIYDCRGRMVAQRRLAIQSARESIFDIPGKFAGGFYTVSVSGKDRNIAAKIVLGP